MMFSKFPKIRPQLPPKIEEIYTQIYKQNREGKSTASSLSQKMESWLHKQVAKDIKGQSELYTLEIGAGTLNQLQYEYSKNYDIIEPFNELFSNSEHLHLINSIYSDINEIPLMPKYDRIISIATFEHVLNLPEVVAKSALLLNEKGSMRISIPNEGGFLWALGWRLTTGLEFRIKYKANYGDIMRHGHVNNANEIEEILRYFFADVRKINSGVVSAFSLYKFFECKMPIIERCQQYLEALKTT